MDNAGNNTSGVTLNGSGALTYFSGSVSDTPGDHNLTSNALQSISHGQSRTR